MSNKYHFVCKHCGHNIGDFKAWFEAGQKCPKCGKNFVDAKYDTNPEKLRSLIFTKDNVGASGTTLTSCPSTTRKTSSRLAKAYRP